MIVSPFYLNFIFCALFVPHLLRLNHPPEKRFNHLRAGYNLTFFERCRERDLTRLKEDTRNFKLYAR
jgi:hypothetical protein